MAPVVARSPEQAEEQPDLKRRRTEEAAATEALPPPAPAAGKAHLNKNSNSFDATEEWRSNLR